MTLAQKKLYERCADTFDRFGPPPIPKSEDCLWECWYQMYLLRLCWAHGLHLPDLMTASVTELVAALERV
jgi:hypothetical protein